MPFDPSKPFEIEGAPKATGFDPTKPFDIVTEEPKVETPTTKVDLGEALKLGGFQGLSLGFVDELSGRLEQLGSVFGRRGWGTEPIFQGRPETPDEQKESLAEVYAKGRNIRREREAAAKKEYPLAYPAAEFVGGMAAPIGAGTAAKSFLGAAAKGAASGTVAGGLQAAGTTEAETGEEIAKESLGGAGLGLLFGAGAGLVGRGLTGVTKTGRESLGAELEAFRRGYKAPVAEESIFASAGPLGRAAGKTLRGAKETISQAEEIGRIKNFLADNKKAYVSQMIDEGMPEERIRAARSILDQMSDDEYIQMMVRSDTPAGRQVQELIARQSAAAFGGREKPEDYARLLGMGIESRSAARNFKAGKEAAGIIEPAQEALSRVTKKTGEKFRELSEQAAEEFQGITPQVVNLLEDVQAKLTDIQDNPRFFSGELKKAIENATDVLTDGIGPSFFKLQPGVYADVDNYEKFNRLQRFKEIIRDTIRPDVLSGKVGVKANTDERLALDLISQADDILKSSDAKVKANSIYAKMRDIEDFVFKGITRKGQVQRGKVEQQLSNRQSAQQWREDLNELRRWADDEVFAPEDRDAVKKFLQVYDEAFQKAEDANLVKGFNWAAGPSSPAIQRFLSAVKNNTEIQDLLQNPAKAVAEIDNFANSYVKQLTGKDKFSDLTDVEQRAFVRAQTWFKKEAEKGLVSPQSLVDNYQLFLKKLQKESAKGGGSGKFFSGQNVKEDIKDALTNYIGTKIGTAGLNELAKAAGSEQGINVFEPLKEDFKKYLMDEYKLTDTQASMVVKVLPDNPLELMGMLPRRTMARMGDVIKFPGKPKPERTAQFYIDRGRGPFDDEILDWVEDIKKLPKQKQPEAARELLRSNLKGEAKEYGYAKDLLEKNNIKIAPDDKTDFDRMAQAFEELDKLAVKKKQFKDPVKQQLEAEYEKQQIKPETSGKETGKERLEKQKQLQLEENKKIIEDMKKGKSLRRYDHQEMRSYTKTDNKNEYELSPLEKAQRKWGPKTELIDDISEMEKQKAIEQSKGIPGAYNRLEEYLLDKPEDKNTAKWLNKARTEEQNEPYIGMDIHRPIAFSSKEKLKSNPTQPIPVKLENIGDLKGILGKGVLTGESDPFAWMDTKYNATKQLLAREKNKPLQIYTRSDLISHDDYIAALDKKNHKINIVISGDNDRLTRLLEPGAPSLKRRIAAANKLKELGYDVKLISNIYENPNINYELDKILNPTSLQLRKNLKDYGLRDDVKIETIETDIPDEGVQNIMKTLGLKEE